MGCGRNGVEEFARAIDCREVPPNTALNGAAALVACFSGGGWEDSAGFFDGFMGGRPRRDRDAFSRARKLGRIRLLALMNLSKYQKQRSRNVEIMESVTSVLVIYGYTQSDAFENSVN